MLYGMTHHSSIDLTMDNVCLLPPSEGSCLSRWVILELLATNCSTMLLFITIAARKSSVYHWTFWPNHPTK